MAPATCPVLLFDKIGSLMSVFISKIKRINRQSSIRITSSAGKKVVHFVLGNKHRVLFPHKTFPCLKRDYLFRKLAELMQHPLGLVMMETHHGRGFLIGFRQSFQPLQ